MKIHKTIKKWLGMTKKPVFRLSPGAIVSVPGKILEVRHMEEGTMYKVGIRDRTYKWRDYHEIWVANKDIPDLWRN